LTICFRNNHQSASLANPAFETSPCHGLGTLFRKCRRPEYQWLAKCSIAFRCNSLSRLSHCYALWKEGGFVINYPQLSQRYCMWF